MRKLNILISAAAIAAASTVMPVFAAGTEVDGAHVNISALWNEARDGTGTYQAPEGQEIESAVPRVDSESRSSYEVKISADKRQAQLIAHARGAGSFWDKKRGWFQGHLHIVLRPVNRT